MPYLAVDKDGTESISDWKPQRNPTDDKWYTYNENTVDIPSGTILKLTGKVMTWADDPVELTEEIVKEPEITDNYTPEFKNWLNKYYKKTEHPKICDYRDKIYGQAFDINDLRLRYQSVMKVSTLQERTTK